MEPKTWQSSKYVCSKVCTYLALQCFEITREIMQGGSHNVILNLISEPLEDLGNSLVRIFNCKIFATNTWHSGLGARSSGKIGLMTVLQIDLFETLLLYCGAWWLWWYPGACRFSVKTVATVVIVITAGTVARDGTCDASFIVAV